MLESVRSVPVSCANRARQVHSVLGELEPGRYPSTGMVTQVAALSFDVRNQPTNDALDLTSQQTGQNVGLRTQDLHVYHAREDTTRQAKTCVKSARRTQ